MAFAGIPATYVHVSTGPTLVTYDSLNLGYSEDRVQIDERPQWEDIRNDAFGGMAGVPSDVQFLGAVHFVHCNLNRFVADNVESLAMIEVDGPANPGDYDTMMGRFMRQDQMYAELVLSNKTATTTYKVAFLRQGRRFNMGTRHQQVALVFECHIDDPCDMVVFTTAAATDPCS